MKNIKKFFGITVILTIIAFTPLACGGGGGGEDDSDGSVTEIFDIWDGVEVDYDWYGDGSAIEFGIRTAAQLKGFANIVNGDDGKTRYNFGGKTVKLLANIDLNDKKWTPIGDYFTNTNNRFAGIFEGNDHKILNLYIDTDKNYQGLFGYVDSGVTVKNLGVSGCIISSGHFVGGVAGSNGGTILDCYNKGTVTGEYSIGGIVGQNTGRVLNCHNTGTVTGIVIQYNYLGAGTKIGGIVGFNLGIITNCFNEGSITGTGDIGGIMGDNNSSGNSKVSNCYNTGTVTSSLSPGSGISSNIGGVAGRNINGATANCYNIGAITPESGHTVGGIVGNGSATNCYNIGTITAEGGYYVGGIVGNGSATNCVSLCLTVNGVYYTGRIFGSGSGSNNKARKDMKIGPKGSEALVTTGTGPSTIHGEDVALGTAQSSVFSGWDFAIWNIPAGNLTQGGPLPTLKAIPQNPAPTLP